MHFEQHTELDNLISMQNLRTSANEGSNDAYDVSVSFTKDTEEFSQFTDSVACREYTLSRDEDSSEPKCWIKGNTKIGPVLEVTTYCLQRKYGVEIRIMSVNKDNSHSRVRISHGLNKLVTNLNNKDQDDNEQETSECSSKNMR